MRCGTDSRPHWLSTNGQADLAARPLSPSAFQLGWHNSPVAWSTVTFEMLVAICLLKHWLCCFPPPVSSLLTHSNPVCHWSPHIIYSRWKSKYRCEAFPPWAFSTSPPCPLSFLNRLHCCGRQSLHVLSSHLMFTHPSFSPWGVIHAWPTS